MEITLEKLRQIIKVVRESPIDGSMAGTGAGTHHAQSGIRMYRGGVEPERVRRGHAKSVRSVEDPGHPVNIAEDDDF